MYLILEKLPFCTTYIMYIHHALFIHLLSEISPALQRLATTSFLPDPGPPVRVKYNIYNNCSPQTKLSTV